LGEEGKIEVAILDKTIYVRPRGYALQANSLGLPDFLAAMFREGCTSVTFDLKDCSGMDSTFLGVIAGAAMARVRPRGKVVSIINAGERAKRQLAFIGLKSVVALVDKVSLGPGLRLAQVSSIHWPKTERERVIKIKQLHEHLVNLNAKNKERFGAAVQMLEAELQEQKSND